MNIQYLNNYYNISYLVNGSFTLDFLFKSNFYLFVLMLDFGIYDDC